MPINILQYSSILFYISNLCNILIIKQNKQPSIPPNLKSNMLENPQKPLPYSLLASMYINWQQYAIPVTYYHYILQVLSRLDKKVQMLVTKNEIDSLKDGTHYYINIMNIIQARQRSLQVIKNNIELLTKYRNKEAFDEEIEHNNNINKVSFDFETKNKYNNHTNEKEISALSKTKYQILKQNQQANKRQTHNSSSSSIKNLIAHIQMYRKLTVQLILLIETWQNQMKSYGYVQSPIQFLYSQCQQDYLLKINTDLQQILQADPYTKIFENNPFLMIRKLHQFSQFSLIYKHLNIISQQQLQKIHECLNILAQHTAQILKHRMLNKHKQTANRKRVIQKSTSVSKIYTPYNKDKDFIVIKDNQMVDKKNEIMRIYGRNNNLSKSIKVNRKQPEVNYREKSINKNDIVINPQTMKTPYSLDKTAKKSPVVSDLVQMMHQSEIKEIKNQIMRQYRKGKLNSYNTNNNLQKSISERAMRPNMHTQPSSKQKYNKMVHLYKSPTQIYSNAKILIQNSKFFPQLNKMAKQQINVQSIHGRNKIVVKNVGGNNKYDEMSQNMGYAIQRKLQILNEVNSELKIKHRSQTVVNMLKKQQQMKQHIFNKLNDKQVVIKVQHTEEKQQPPVQNLPIEEIDFKFQTNINQNQILHYLQANVFHVQPQVSFEEIEKVAKIILAQHKQITLISITNKLPKSSKNNQINEVSRIGWMAVKFIQKNQKMRRCAHIIYLHKFASIPQQKLYQKLTNKLLQYGYGAIKVNNETIVQKQSKDILLRNFLTITYKLPPNSTKLQKQQLKQQIQRYKTLRHSRLLKYYTYSKQTKYHKYCIHSNTHSQTDRYHHRQVGCAINYKFLQLCKISIDGISYMKAKCEKIYRIKRNVYRIRQYINETDLIISKKLDNIIQLQEQQKKKKKYSDEESQQQPEQQLETKYKYIAIKETKFIRKFTTQSNSNQIIVNEIVNIGGMDIPQVKSINLANKEIQDILVMKQPYYIGIVTRKTNKEDDKSKTLAIVEIE